MSVRDDIANLKSEIAKRLLSNLADELEEAIFVPNSVLPEKFHGRKEYEGYKLEDGKLEKQFGRSLKSLKKVSKQIEEDELDNRESAILSYSSNYDNNEPISYTKINERKQNNAELAFFNVFVKMGIIEV